MSARTSSSGVSGIWTSSTPTASPRLVTGAYSVAPEAVGTTPTSWSCIALPCRAPSGPPPAEPARLRRPPTARVGPEREERAAAEVGDHQPHLGGAHRVGEHRAE